MTKVVALVPMRHDSERVPGKNYRMFGGKPLYHHIIETLLACPRIVRTVIDTDSELIRSDAAGAFPLVEIRERPADLRDGRTPMNSVLRSAIRDIEADLYLQTHSTNPLLTTDSVTRAIDTYLEADGFDSLFSVTRLQTRLWSSDATPINHDPVQLLRTQDLPPVFEENSCLYLFSRAGLERRGSRIGERPLLFELPRDEAWDIDEAADFTIAEAIYRARTA